MSDHAALTLFTIGYQGQTLESFRELLLAHGVAHVIDVRQRPQSRKPDFGKKRLTAHLAAEGIGYTHLVELGTPQALRDAVRRDHDYAAFFAALRPLIAAQPAALAAALTLIETQSCALLCFEHDHRTCHRTIVAEALMARAPGRLRVVDLA
jgi:uncharacterized protein (DUF488 family)